MALLTLASILPVSYIFSPVFGFCRLFLLFLLNFRSPILQYDCEEFLGQKYFVVKHFCAASELRGGASFLKVSARQLLEGLIAVEHHLPYLHAGQHPLEGYICLLLPRVLESQIFPQNVTTFCTPHLYSSHPLTCDCPCFKALAPCVPRNLALLCS